MTKQAQTQQVFIYIMVILVVGAVLLLGYKSINDVMNKSCTVDQATFKNDFTQLLERNSGYGDIYKKALGVPCDVDAICFVNKTVTNPETKITNPLILQSYQAGATDNVFLIKGTTLTPLLSKDNLDVKDGFFCINNTAGKFNIMLEGIGKGKVQVSPQ